ENLNLSLQFKASKLNYNDPVELLLESKKTLVIMFRASSKTLRSKIDHSWMYDKINEDRKRLKDEFVNKVKEFSSLTFTSPSSSQIIKYGLNMDYRSYL
ncbi:hypothetical protein CR513_56763, partial [Mucuna pruriens]